MRVSCSMRRDSSESGPGHRGRGALERLLETETGFDRDHEQVEGVGQPALDLFAAAGDPTVEDDVGAEEAHAPGEQHDQDLQQPVAAEDGDRERDPHDARSETEQLEDQEAVDLVAGRAPGEHDLALHVLVYPTGVRRRARSTRPRDTGANTRAPIDSSISCSRTSASS